MTDLAGPLSSDATVGILGGGQLGRMLALAAAKLGLKCHIYSPDPDSPAFDVARRSTHAEYGDKEALDRFAAEVDVVTYEFENVPADTARFLSSRVPVLPNPAVLATTQDRLTEKTFVSELGIGAARFAAIESLAELERAAKEIGLPAVLKTRRFGYDGKGQASVRAAADLSAAWDAIARQPAILEAFVPFEREVSVVAARSHSGEVVCFDLTENEHRDHILKVSRAPADVPPELSAEALAIAEKIGTASRYVGVFAVEMFLVRGGDGPRLLVNEIAPRVHNSGHWTLDGASVSQFEQHIRAVAGWPLGKPVRHSRVEMINLIGDEVHDAQHWLGVPGASLHLYGKDAVRPGRKMGHVTRLLP
ncbi:MAG: 5-(carboxyamino)imidazole ribonucleotide synthase [Variibacter sp.]|nr:5-(carboxyamino)imidazole ribonucleotide synthase [Variibacter sp.]